MNREEVKELLNTAHREAVLTRCRRVIDDMNPNAIDVWVYEISKLRAKLRACSDALSLVTT